MKTVVEQVVIAFRQWQKDWENYDGKKPPKPLSFDEFIKPFLELEKQYIMNAWIDKRYLDRIPSIKKNEAERYYNETFNK